MNLTLMVLAGLLLSPSILVAQQIIPSLAQACPVGLQAKQGGATDLVKVRHAPEAQPETRARPGQRIHLIVTSPGSGSPSSKIVGATVTARGLSARGRVNKASGSKGAAEVRRTLNVTFSGAKDSGLLAELNLPGFTAVKSIKIEALEYADGSTRDFAGQKMCTVAPDPLMLIGSR